MPSASLRARSRARAGEFEDEREEQARRFRVKYGTQAANRALHDLEACGLIRLEHAGVTVLDRAKLAAFDD